MKKTVKTPFLAIALVPVCFLVGILWFSLVYLRTDTTELSPHIALILGTIVASVVAIFLGYSWKQIETGMVKGITLALKPILILLVIGLLVASWIQAGIVPTMIVYGLNLLSPSIFLPATCVICAFISLGTGSSWTTAATVGVALMGVGDGLGIPKTMIAGAIISGAYFGDKMSPLSDTTNLAPAVAGAQLFSHVKHMIYTTGPSFIISLIIFLILGMDQEGVLNSLKVEAIENTIRENYFIHPALLIAPFLVIAMVVLKLPALPALIGGVFLGAAMSVIFQEQELGNIFAVAYDGANLNTGNIAVDSLLSKGGLSSMYGTVALIICALSFGGVMEHSGMLSTIARAILKSAKGTGTLITATVFTCIGMNFLASDQYMAIVLPGRMYKVEYKKKGLAAVNLSRALEDSGTLTSALIPWNTCGAFMITTLDLDPWTYVPFCFLNLINPLISIFYGFTGITIKKLNITKQLSA